MGDDEIVIPVVSEMLVMVAPRNVELDVLRYQMPEVLVAHKTEVPDHGGSNKVLQLRLDEFPGEDIVVNFVVVAAGADVVLDEEVV